MAVTNGLTFNLIEDSTQQLIYLKNALMQLAATHKTYRIEP